jgi:hypothetical protein
MYLADSSRNVPFLLSMTEPMDGWIMLPVNELYCGDNLEILREYIAPESVDLIYLDPASTIESQNRIAAGDHRW